MRYVIKDSIGVFEKILESKFCVATIEAFNKMEKNNFTIKRRDCENTTKTLKDDTSFSSYLFLDSGFLDNFVVGKLYEVVEQSLKIYLNEYSVLKDLENQMYIDSLKIQKTTQGQGYHVWHFEQGTRKDRNRVLAYTLYLNNVEEGGETEFLYLGKRLKPQEGTLAIFPAGFTHTHRGNPPLKDSKYIITGWINFV